MEDVLALVYIFASVLFIFTLLLRSKKYFVKKRVSGEVLLKIRPYGLRILYISLCLLVVIAAVCLAFWVLRRFEPVTMIYFNVYTRLILSAWILVVIVFEFFPTKVCENGIIDPYDYVSWSSVTNYTRKSDTYVVLELDKLHALNIKLKLRHPPEYRNRIDAILSENVRAEQA